MIDINEIMRLLPHTYPFLLVDKIIEFVHAKKIVGIKNVTYNEPFFQGHFPGRPIMPGVLIVEAMAQTGGVLAFKSFPDLKGSVFFIGIDNARFRKPVVPGDQLKLSVEVIRHKKELWVFSGEAYVEDEKVAEARIMAMLKQD
ncbi:MAG TPA: 3-hydroxyacyl-ACP dehydratase FabZ [Syntrophorhabdaceae bacterium]|nr:3-hydroxyacyl-ACP dehydratase FabZ [Syntrophorhabdaceae bacterium]HOL05054.1 3-hydroxyacyl-ACP dehydratase FabZ [Syntrophorhabdaceae bacterium]HON85366.1 3-hydroxyacyl-ACP dehydratase FabZ [Syntrophorhabdaceae bacterium]HOT41600.1 3-hydroxyacyl-ACP dehydratase FabZ [Syntrophorhabdaceae bacterium]HPC66947.1 3-hydroxyacyl-ACP dehydratase FabZ [Syntrophorhabdaceae bacterium]